jgi:hypothetical protein
MSAFGAFDVYGTARRRFTQAKSVVTLWDGRSLDAEDTKEWRDVIEFNATIPHLVTAARIKLATETSLDESELEYFTDAFASLNSLIRSSIMTWLNPKKIRASLPAEERDTIASVIVQLCKPIYQNLQVSYILETLVDAIWRAESSLQYSVAWKLVVAYFTMRRENTEAWNTISTLPTSKEAAEVFYNNGLYFARLVQYCEDEAMDSRIDGILRQIEKLKESVRLGGHAFFRRRQFLNTSPRTRVWRRKEYGAHYME